MKIYDEHQKLVGELERPEPVEQEGKWYEAVEYRPKKKTDLFARDGLGKRTPYPTTQYPVWILQVIPRATPEQLATIGMCERDKRPVEVKLDEIAWLDNSGVFGNAILGMNLWVLVPVEKPLKCPSCADNVECPRHIYLENGDCFVPVEKVKEDVHMTFDDPGEPIRDTPEPDAPRFTVEQIAHWIRGNTYVEHPGMPELLKEKNKSILFLADYLYDQEDGIRAVTERVETEPAPVEKEKKYCGNCGKRKNCALRLTNSYCDNWTPKSVEKEVVHTSCVGCAVGVIGGTSQDCTTCFPWYGGSNAERRNYIPVPEPEEPNAPPVPIR